MEKSQLYQKAFDKYGILQLVVAIEEMSELQKELTKILRGDGDTDHLVEEVADVEIMVEQIRNIYELGLSVETVKKLKLERLEKRLND